MPIPGHKSSNSLSQNIKAQLANAYNELGKELSSNKIRVVGNYTLGKVIGEGTYGKVRLGTHRLTSTRVAIKQVPKSMSAALTREIHHHRQLHHPHTTQMYEVIASESSIWIVTELCCGGELFDYLVEKGRLPEDEAKIIFGQLCLAVAYLHDKGIVHRDLKLENVLLDERCRVKLSDFGFTREYERGTYMETFCGTTGYAAPEILLRKKYMGPEVDVWSLGVILYCLLTGTLPFDDDDEDVMRAKIIRGGYEDHEWLSLESRDLLQRILEKDVAKRFTIPQILGHPWFASQARRHSGTGPPMSGSVDSALIADSPTQMSSSIFHDDVRRSSVTSISSAGSSSSFMLTATQLNTSTPTTPDDISNDRTSRTDSAAIITSQSARRNSSETTLPKISPGRSDQESTHSELLKGSSQTVFDEETTGPKPGYSSVPSSDPNPHSSKAPPMYPIRTPARTKRRSVSSVLSDHSLPRDGPIPAALSPLRNQDSNFASLLNSPTPIIFSTPLERELLSTLSALGFDTAQIVHSVLTDACDAAGAVWWMLRKRVEKRLLEEGDQSSFIDSLIEAYLKEPKSSHNSPHEQQKEKPTVNEKHQVDAGVQVDLLSLSGSCAAPQLALVPATPTFNGPSTPPRPNTPTRTPLLSPSSTVTTESLTRSHPTTPAPNVKERETKNRKPRSGSVSIMQRATTALEAAGLVRKKSTEGVKEDRERERSKEMDRRAISGEEPRNSHGSGSSKLTKSPPLKPYKGPITPPRDLQRIASVSSPWVLADGKESLNEQSSRAEPPMPATVPGAAVHSDVTQNNKGRSNLRGRANLLNALRLWFHEDRKGKRKETSTKGQGVNTYTRSSVMHPFNSGHQSKRRGSTSSSKFGSRTGHRPQRPSFSSRRSSSVNSRRSSVTSNQMVLLDSSHQLPSRRSFGNGSHTPNSDKAGEASSRPSSIRSFSMQQPQRHRKSPSTSSAGSAHFRTASPLQKYHRRGGSGSSTRVVRQIQATSRTLHMRTSSTASSIHSAPSSRPTSFYEASEGEGVKSLLTSPTKSRSRQSADDTVAPRRSSHVNSSTASTFIAQKRQAPFLSPISHSYTNSFGRSSWKKTWGLEPPGWKSRTTYFPVEVLDVSSVNDSSIRDVFSGHQSLSLGDESDWVDEDDEIPAFAGGLGQLSAPLPAPGSNTNVHKTENVFSLSPAPQSRVPRSINKRTSRNSAPPANRQQVVNSSGRLSPLPSDNAIEQRTSRRQLPIARTGPAFRQAIQEEDEGEEEC